MHKADTDNSYTPPIQLLDPPSVALSNRFFRKGYVVLPLSQPFSFVFILRALGIEFDSGIFIYFTRLYGPRLPYLRCISALACPCQTSIPQT